MLEKSTKAKLTNNIVNKVSAMQDLVINNIIMQKHTLIAAIEETQVETIFYEHQKMTQ